MKCKESASGKHQMKLGGDYIWCRVCGKQWKKGSKLFAQAKKEMKTSAKGHY